MSTPKNQWLAAFPALFEITDPAWKKVTKSAHLVTFEAGTRLFREKDACGNFLLIVKGSVRVQRLSTSGQVITLYHLEPGKVCDLTTSCLLGGRSYPAEGIAETRVQAVLIPQGPFREAIVQSPKFSEFVFSSLDRGVNELITLVEEVAFGHMDRRLAHCLLQKARSRSYVKATHQELAEELGTAREVVSRVLKEFERHGWVRLYRGRIDIRKHDSLAALADTTVV